MKLRELERQDADKPKDQPKELRELATRIKSYVKEAEDSKLRKRAIKVADRIDKMLIDGHLFNLNQDQEQSLQVGDAWYPKMHILQVILEMALPKVIDKHYRPSVVVEESKRKMFPSDDKRVQALRKMSEQSGLLANNPQMPLPDQAAEMLNGAIEYHREQSKLDKNTRNLGLFTLTYGECWRKDGYTNDVKDTLVSMRDIYDDPYARCPEERRYVIQEFSDTLGNIRKDYPEWGHLVRPTDNQARKNRSLDEREDTFRESRAVHDEENVKNSRVPMYCAYLKDEHSTEPVYKTVRVTDPENRQILLENGFTAEPVYDTDQETNQNTLVGWDMRIETGETKQKYPSGWRQVIVAGDVVLDDGNEGKLPEGATLPLHQAGCFPIENTNRFKGLGEIILDNSHMINVFYKYALEDVQAGALDVIDESVVDPNSISYNSKKRGSRRQTLRFKSNKGADNRTIDSVFRSYPAGETSQSILALIEACRLMLEWSSGQFDPRMGMTANRDQSGELVKELRDGSYERLGPVKESISETVEGVCRNWVHYLVSYQKDVRQYRRKSLFGDQLLQFAPIVLGMFEWNFDVKVGDGGSLPDDPEEAADYLEAFVARIMGQPKPIRDMLIKLRRFPFERELIMALDQAEQMMQQQQQQGEQVDPVVQKMREEAVKELAQALGDVASEDNAGAARGPAVQALMGMSAGQVPQDPNLAAVIGQIPPEKLIDNLTNAPVFN